MNIIENLAPIAMIASLLPVAIFAGFNALKLTLHPTAAQMAESE